MDIYETGTGACEAKTGGEAMTAQELIDELMKIEDKTLPVYASGYHSYDNYPVGKVEVAPAYNDEPEMVFFTDNRPPLFP